MIFSTPNAIVITGLKHGSSQLYHSAHNTLGIPYKAGNELEFVRFFDPKKVFNLIDQGIKGEDLLKKMNFSLTNSNFSKMNYLYDFSTYRGKPLIFLIRDPLKAANSSIIEDLVMFLNSHSGLLATKSKKIREVFEWFDTHYIAKGHLEQYKYAEDLFFELNSMALSLESSSDTVIFEHLDYEHLAYVARIATFFELNKQYKVDRNMLFLNIDDKFDFETSQTLNDDWILTQNLPSQGDHTTSSLVKKLPNFIKNVQSQNIIYNRRLHTETALYSFINSQYKNKLFTLDRYSKIVTLYKGKMKEAQFIKKDI